MKSVRIFQIILLLVAFIMTMAVIIPSGSHYCFNSVCGIYFWGAHEHDSIWHLAVINTLLDHWPFQFPNISGVTMSSYNYLMDIVIAVIAKISKINSSIWYFKILPIAWFATISYLSYNFALSYRKSKTFPIFMWLFLFFGSSFSYLIQWRNLGTIWGGSSVISMQAILNMLNPQFAWSLIPLLLILTGMNRERKTMRDYVIYGFLSMLALGLKFYTGAAILLILGFDLVGELYQKGNKLIDTVYKGLVLLGFSAIAIWLFYSPGQATGFPFMFRPFATVNPIIEDKSLFYLPTWAVRLYSYQGVKLAIVESLVLLIFLFLNYGTRILAILFNFGSDQKTAPQSKKLIVMGAISTALMAILLVQRGVWWNTVQFLYVSLFLTGILAGEAMDKLWTKGTLLTRTVVIVLAALMIPNNLDAMRTFMHVPGTGYIPASELAALEYLKNSPNGVVLAPYLTQSENEPGLTQIQKKYDTGYISAYTNKQTYLNDTIQLVLTNIEYKSRQEKVESRDCSVLTQVKYIYEQKDQPFVSEYDRCQVKILKVMENSAVSVYLVN